MKPYYKHFLLLLDAFSHQASETLAARRTWTASQANRKMRTKTSCVRHASNLQLILLTVTTLLGINLTIRRVLPVYSVQVMLPQLVTLAETWSARRWKAGWCWGLNPDSVQAIRVLTTEHFYQPSQSSISLSHIIKHTILWRWPEVVLIVGSGYKHEVAVDLTDAQWCHGNNMWTRQSYVPDFYAF